MGPSEITQYRSLFISDVHLGTKGCQAGLFLDFLRHNEADMVYLVGDIIDGWRLKQSWYWPQSHNDIIQKLLRKVRKGTRMVYVPGNHDEFLRDYVGHSFGGVEIMLQTKHRTADGRTFLIMHGDEYDIVVRHAKWLAFLGDWAYRFALFVNTYLNLVRRRMGFSYWSISAWLKLKVKNAVNFIGTFETSLSEEAARQKVDGVICGHIHHPTIRDINGITYINIGDFVESCSVLAEHHDGRLEIVRWLVSGPLREPAEETTTAEPMVLA